MSTPFNDLPEDCGDAPVAMRRSMLLLLGSAALSPVLAQAGGASTAARRSPCVVTPEQMEGPYFVDRRLERSDMRSDVAGAPPRPGVPLHLALTVSSIGAGGCMPLAGAMVDVWHCDAAGRYSLTDPGPAGEGSPFLRGYQVTDASGGVAFTTIYPGWYPGRAVHVHFKVRSASASGRRHEFASQLYFDDATTARVHARAPYSARGGRPPRNRDDGLFRHDGGERLMVALNETGQGYEATFDIALRTG